MAGPDAAEGVAAADSERGCDDGGANLSAGVKPLLPSAAERLVDDSVCLAVPISRPEKEADIEKEEDGR